MRFYRDERGFTGAEKALLACFGLSIISLTGYLLGQGSDAAAGDARKALMTRTGGTDIKLGQNLGAQRAAEVQKPAPAAAPPAPLSHFSGDFAPTGAAPPPPKAPAPTAPPPKAPAPTGGVSLAALEQVMPDLPAAKAQAYIGPMNAAMREYGINTPARQAAFLAQIAEESIQLTAFNELASGREYEGRCADLGNCQPGDGVRYKGRGPIQLTGRANYRRVGAALGLDLEGHPELASTPEVGFRVAGYYWQTHGLNQLADQGNFREITHRINGGYNGESTREFYWGRARRALGI